MPGAVVPTRYKPWIVVGLSLALCVASWSATPTTSEAGRRWTFKGVESCFMKRINNVRERDGLRRLNRDKQLGYVARRHARKMASDRAIYHDDGLGRKITRWQALGQNTGRGASCRRLFRAFMNSSVHRGNILGPWRYFGVGVKRRNGTVYAQQVFESQNDPGNVFHYP